VSGSRFVDVPADRLLAELKEIGLAVMNKGGMYVMLAPPGRETLVDLTPPNVFATVRIFTTVTANADSVRPCGEDAIRLFVKWDDGTPGGKLHFLEEVQKILRTAPQGAPDRVRAFLDRLRDEVRAAYGRALHVPTCPVCKTRPMKLKSTRDGTRKFYGCVGWPGCSGTQSVARPT
jgi:hypothetical protein